MMERLSLTSDPIVVGLFHEARSILDNPNISLSLNNAELWNEVFNDAVGTDAGIAVTKDRALQCPPFWQAVQLIAGDAGALPLSVYRRTSTGTRDYFQEDPSHWAYSLVRIKASDHETSQDYWERLMCDALIWGAGWGLIIRDQSAGRRPSELLHLLPDRTSWETIDGEQYCASEIGGRVRVFAPEDVICVSGLMPLGSEPPDFVKQARETIAAYLAANRFLSKFFKNGARVGGILELPLGMSKTARDTVEEGFRKTYESPDSAFKTVILRENAKFHAAQTSPKDVMVTESKEQLARDVARYFNLPPSKLNIEGSSSYNSKAEDTTGYLTHCLRRWLLKIANQCRLRLIPTRDQASIEFRHDTDELLRMDLTARATAYNLAIQGTWMSPNEARLKESMPPRDGGDEFVNPNTSSPVTTTASDVESEPPGQSPDDTPGDSADSTDSESGQTQPTRASFAVRRGVVMTCLAARHKARKPSAFVDFLGKLDRSTVWGAELGAAFDTVVETVTNDELATAINTTCANFERLYLGE